MTEKQPVNIYQLDFRSISDEMEGNESIFEFLPYSNLKRWIYDTSIYEEAHGFLPLMRLHDVRTLSFLSFLGKERELFRYIEPSTHTRYDHSLVVAMVCEEILKQNCFPQDEINKGILAGLVHDIATPAHGDAIKKVDPAHLDEEAFWAEAIGQKGLDYLESYGISEEGMDQIIHGQGILGKVLDAADRITYTMKDIYNVYNALLPPSGEFDFVFFPLYDIVSKNPYIGDVYKDINIKRSTAEVFFSDPEKLLDFLTLRAVVSKNYYYNPSSQGRDFLIKLLTQPIYSTDKNSLLNPVNLRVMSDEGLLTIIKNFYGIKEHVYMLGNLIDYHPKYEIFGAEDEAKKRAEELEKDSDLWVLGVNYCKGFSPATDTLVYYEGAIMPIEEAMPWKTCKLQEMSDSVKGFYVFYSARGENSFVDMLLQKLSEKTN